VSTGEQLSWDNFKSTVLVRGQQRVHRVANSPSIEVFGDGVLNRIGVWLETSAPIKVPDDLTRLAFITARTLTRDGREFLEIATSTPLLQRQFYHFAVAVSERMLLAKLPASDAVSLELQCFADLLQESPSLGIERQVGLLGELLFLERLVQKVGMDALDSWVGPQGEPHDFRIGSREFEIKTTLSARRIHTIHGAEQLVPSADCRLYLISIQLGPPGASEGFALATKARALRDHFAAVPNRLTQFTSALESCGFREEEGAKYSRQFVLRNRLAMVCVDNGFPAITSATIRTALGPLAPRVGALNYDVNIAGLEHEEGTTSFDTVLAI
jgi:hypothetical protein